MSDTAVTAPTSLDLSQASHREPLGPTAEGLSSASFERVVIAGRRYVIKRLSYDTDWVMRASAETGVPRAVRMFLGGVFDLLPACLDTALERVAYDPVTGMTELLMRDVSETFLKDDDVITAEIHERLLDAMAQQHVATWGLADEVGLASPAQRWQILGPDLTARETARGPVTGVPAIVGPMWGRLAQADPTTHATLARLVADPMPLVRALAATPRALVHGDWKGGNLGLHVDGRVVLVDWAFPGLDAPCADLGWYLAVNCDRLPESKEASIDTYRAALERHGVPTTAWWDVQLPLALLGCAVQMAWSKCDQPDELAWWAARVAAATPLLT